VRTRLTEEQEIFHVCDSCPLEPQHPAFSHGVAHRCAVGVRDLELVISGFILEELGRKLVEKSNFPRRDADRVDAFLRRVSIVVVPADLPSDLCRDPTDLPVLGTAVAGASALLISVDRDLLDMRMVRAIPIIRPGEYWRCSAEIE
jgi:predicted nucleic acid-binding protein